MKFLLRGALICLVLCGAWKLIFPSATIRYRINLDLLVDGQAKAGSTVLATTYARTPQLLGSSANIAIAVDGDAMVMDLGTRGKLLMLLSSNNANPRPDPELIVPSLFGTTSADLISTAVHGKRELPLGLLPPIAIIKDPMDPASVRYVVVKELPQQIEEGVTLQRATLEIVDDGVFLLKSMGLSGSQPKATFMSQFPWTNNPPACEEFFKRLIATGFNPGTSVGLSRLVSR